MTIRLTVNGAEREVASEPETPLLYVLRDELGLNGAKYGCGIGQCGACTVIVDNEAVLSCTVPALLMAGREVTTLEGLGTPDAPGAMQRAFIEAQAAQCGFCIPGIMMRAEALLRRNPAAGDREIREALEYNLCRCGTHMRILRAVHRAVELKREESANAGRQPA